MPVPLKLIVCVVGDALSVIVIVALRPLIAVGVNVAATTQLAVGASVPTVRQSVPLPGVARAKSPTFVPPRITLVILRVAVPAFVSVTVCCPLVKPRFTLPNVIELDVRLATGCVPVPFSAMVWGLLASTESVIVRVALRLPAPVGWKIILTVQMPVVAGIIAPFVQVLVPSVKSLALVPVIAGVPETVTEEAVRLLSVTVWGALGVPTN